MAELVPYPFDRLIRRMFRELERNRSIFDLPERKFVLGDPERDLSVNFQRRKASSPLGPAAGPQSQLAQNIVLSWLGGGRIFELKTVQILDRLKIPRPCIDLQTVGYNVEWSQELTLEQSLEEYVKASMLLEILVASGKVPVVPGFDRSVFDMSVGYDLKGIQSERVGAFIEGMLDAGTVVERLRKQIPEEYRAFRDLEFQTCLSESLTLSTFHGCPPDEIERMLDYLIRKYGLHCIVKLNPTLLGKDEARRIFNDVLGYRERIPDSAFENDTKWDQAVAFVERLKRTSEDMGCRFGVKFSNTLIVENHRDFFPKTEKEMYLSGPPLHVLAMSLVARFRKTFGGKFPISFSAGIDRANFPEAASLGLAPVSVCSDLLRPGGYGRMAFYFLDLKKRMQAVGARDMEEFVLLGHGQAEEALERTARNVYGGNAREAQALATALAVAHRMEGAGNAASSEMVRYAKANPPPECCGGSFEGDGPDDFRTAAAELWSEWLEHARVLNTERYLEKLLSDPRYTHAANTKIPPKVGTRLELFNCITCDKCVPVCPNDANFTYTLPKIEIPVVKMRRENGGWVGEPGPALKFDKKHQLANFADFCNECGNCDVFCPEDGGPYVLKPRFFGSREQWELYKTHDGFFLESTRGADGAGEVLGRFEGKEYRLALSDGRATFEGEGFTVRFAEEAPEKTIEGDAAGEVDLTYFHIMNWLRKAIFDGNEVNYVNA